MLGELAAPVLAASLGMALWSRFPSARERSVRHAEHIGTGVRWLLRLLAMAAACSAAYVAGMYMEQTQGFPYRWAHAAQKTMLVHLRQWNAQGEESQGAPRRGTSVAGCAASASELQDMIDAAFFGRRLTGSPCPATDVSGEEAAARRVEFLAGPGLAEPVVFKGEVGTFLDYCPGPWGCLAVEYSRSGSVSHVWPFRPVEIGQANIVPESAYPYEVAVGWSFSKHVKRAYVSQYPGGDLLVMLWFAKSYPDAGGVARVAPDGQPRWYRKDYSHHWPFVVDEELALVPSMNLSRPRLSYAVGAGHRQRTMKLECHQPAAHVKEDKVVLVDGKGSVLREYPVLDAIVRSRYVGHLVGADGCDPTHMNFVHVIGKDSTDSAGAVGLAKGDMVVSLRNLSAFGILDKDDGRLKRLVRGSFHYQHGVRHLERARFLMFDNHGTDGAHGPSRLLMVDVESGRETTVFPTDATPNDLRLGLAHIMGQFDVSADRRRALVTDVRNARSLEIRLADGEVLNVFHSIHDVSGWSPVPPPAARNAWRFVTTGIHYARSDEVEQSVVERSGGVES